jgi:DNA-binding CsgD family transcriptional regulator
LYTVPEPAEPVNVRKPTKTERNTRMREMYASGYTLEQIAVTYGISIARVWEIVRCS